MNESCKSNGLLVHPRAWRNWFCFLLLLLPGLALGAPFAYIANESTDNVSVIDTATNTVVATVPVGNGPTAVAVNPASPRVYVANTSGNTVSVIDTTTHTVVATVAVGIGPLGVAVNPAGTQAYVVSFALDAILVINTATNTVSAPSSAPRPPGDQS